MQKVCRNCRENTSEKSFHLAVQPPIEQSVIRTVQNAKGTRYPGILLSGMQRLHAQMNTTHDTRRRASAARIAGMVLLLLFGAGQPSGAVMPSNDDCAKCHVQQANDRARAGGKHRSVPCIGCHVGHPPEVKKPIALCSKCHQKTKKAHFGVNGCLDCHRNPHTPKVITFSDKNQCFNCHGAETELITTHKTKHSAVGCATCHDVHRKIPKCTQCHQPHAPDITTDECKKCHKSPHMPMPVTYAADLPSRYCGACHGQILNELTASKTKHKTFLCVFCHKEKHGTVPRCQDCHGSPHPAGIMRKFPKCVDCHKSPHDLNNWTAAAPAQTAEPPASSSP